MTRKGTRAVRWPWSKREPPPEIPPFRLPVDIKPLEPKDPGMIVTETEMSETGMFRIFPWLKKKDEPNE
jgi:hypothetical protein